MVIQKNSGSIPSLGLRILNGHGIEGDNVSLASVGQRLTLDVYLKETCNFFQTLTIKKY